MLKLRQICCDPRLAKLEQAHKLRRSAKLELLLEMLPELLAEGRRILLFSQFTSMLSLIEAELKHLDIGYGKLTGQTRKREQVIEEFRSGAVPLFLISLKAGGVGLNLTEADTVIHFDPWWNPAVENQATDRAHRIGQTIPCSSTSWLPSRRSRKRSWRCRHARPHSPTACTARARTTRASASARPICRNCWNRSAELKTVIQPEPASTDSHFLLRDDQVNDFAFVAMLRELKESAHPSAYSFTSS